MNRSVQYLVVALALAALAALTGCDRGEPTPVLAGDPDGVVATVEGAPITRGEINRLIDNERTRHDEGVDVDALRRGALETLIGSELMYRAALARGMSVPPERLAEELAGVRSQFAREADFASYLAASGLDEATLEERSSRRLLVAAYARLVVDEAAPTEAELREAYEARRASFIEPESIRAQQILVQAKRQGDPVENNRIARQTADEAHRRLKAGESFETVAAELSTGPNSRKGGEMGWFKRGRWMKGFDEVVFATPVGELTDVFRTKIGLHVVRVLERREPREQTFDEVRNALTLQLTRERRDTALETHVRALMDEAQIDLLDADLRRAMERGGS